MVARSKSRLDFNAKAGPPEPSTSIGNPIFGGGDVSTFFTLARLVKLGFFLLILVGGQSCTLGEQNLVMDSFPQRPAAHFQWSAGPVVGKGVISHDGRYAAVPMRSLLRNAKRDGLVSLRIVDLVENREVSVSSLGDSRSYSGGWSSIDSLFLSEGNFITATLFRMYSDGGLQVCFRLYRFSSGAIVSERCTADRDMVAARGFVASENGEFVAILGKSRYLDRLGKVIVLPSLRIYSVDEARLVWDFHQSESGQEATPGHVIFNPLDEGEFLFSGRLPYSAKLKGPPQGDAEGSGFLAFGETDAETNELFGVDAQGSYSYADYFFLDVSRSDYFFYYIPVANDLLDSYEGGSSGDWKVVMALWPDSESRNQLTPLATLISFKIGDDLFKPAPSGSIVGEKHWAQTFWVSNDSGQRRSITALYDIQNGVLSDTSIQYEGSLVAVRQESQECGLITNKVTGKRSTIEYFDQC